MASAMHATAESLEWPIIMQFTEVTLLIHFTL